MPAAASPVMVAEQFASHISERGELNPLVSLLGLVAFSASFWALLAILIF